MARRSRPWHMSRRGNHHFPVKAHVAYYPDRQKARRAIPESTCPWCHAPTRVVQMPNGGWAQYEQSEGIERIHHSCWHDRLSNSRRRDDETLDLFDWALRQFGA